MGNVASSDKEPPDRPVSKYFKCHPKIQVSTVICIICENAYHKSDFQKIKDHKYAGTHLVLCPEHNVKDLTSQTSEHMLSDTAKK